MNGLQTINNIVVIKVGTNTLADTYEGGLQELRPDVFMNIGSQVRKLRANGKHLVIVTSAGITAGMAEMGIKERPKATERSIPYLQMLAGVGWRPLLNQWDSSLMDLISAGMLLTRQELDLGRPERTEVLHNLYTALRHGVVPIINENDAVTHSEITYGDNDALAATLAASIAQSDLFGNNVSLVMLSDVDGVYEDIATPESLIRVIDSPGDFEHLAEGAKSEHSKGGMKSKITAAEIATKAGVDMWIANGRVENAIQRAMDGDIGTYFPARSSS